MRDYENRKYTTEFTIDEKEKSRVWLEVSMSAVEKKVAEKIMCEAEEFKERIEKILAE